MHTPKTDIQLDAQTSFAPSKLARQHLGGCMRTLERRWGSRPAYASANVVMVVVGYIVLSRSHALSQTADSVKLAVRIDAIRSATVDTPIGS